MNITNWGPVTQLIFMPRLFPLNCYLIEDEEGITLIDACMPIVAKRIQSAIAATGKPLTRILLTHAHEDHIGAIPHLKKVYPQVKIGMSQREAAILGGDHSLLPHEAQTPLKGGLPKKALFSPDFVIEDKEQIGSLIAVATPGHSPGHLSYLDTITQTLFTGDAFQTKGGLAVSGHLKWKFPFPALATWHIPTAITSAQRLVSLNPSVLVVGHGPAILLPVDQMNSAIRQAQEHMIRRKQG